MLSSHSGANGCVLGAYECVVDASDVGGDRPLLTFSRELFSREFVIKRVALEVTSRSISHSRLARGHAVVSVDGVSVREMSSKEFEAIWRPIDREMECKSQWRVRFRDRSRAQLAEDMTKESASRSSFFKLLPVVPGNLDINGEDELQVQLCHVQENIWRFELDAANALLRVLPGAADPLLLLQALELETVRYLASHDALDLKKARTTAARTVGWLEKLAALSSLAAPCRLQSEVALAEALLMRALVEALNVSSESAALTSMASTVTTIATCVHRSSSIYCELVHRSPANADHKTRHDHTNLPERIALDLDSRVRFGDAVLRLCGSLVWRNNPLEWLKASLLPVFGNEESNGKNEESTAIRASLNVLFALARPNSKDKEQNTSPSKPSKSTLRQHWAELLLLLVGPTAIRVLADDDSGGGDRTRRFLLLAQYRKELQDLRKEVRRECSSSPLLMWAAGAIDHAASKLPTTERAHLVRFEAGYLQFARLEFDDAVRQLTLISRCESAPKRLRSFSCVFVATAYLMSSSAETATVTQLFSQKQPQPLLRSVRVLLRSARRILSGVDSTDMAGNTQADHEVDCLRHRLDFYVDCGDRYLLMLPAEVFCILSNSSLQKISDDSGDSCAVSSVTEIEERKRYANVLRLLNLINDFSDASAAHNKPCEDPVWRAEWLTLRAVTLYHMDEDDGHHNLGKKSNLTRTELEKLILHISTSIYMYPDLLSRLIQSFVVPVALFYQLKLNLLERRAFSEKAGSISSDTRVLLDLWSFGQSFGNPYWTRYEGKVNALRRLLSTRRMSSSLSTTSSDGGSIRSRVATIGDQQGDQQNI